MIETCVFCGEEADDLDAHLEGCEAHRKHYDETLAGTEWKPKRRGVKHNLAIPFRVTLATATYDRAARLASDYGLPVAAVARDALYSGAGLVDDSGEAGGRRVVFCLSTAAAVELDRTIAESGLDEKAYLRQAITAGIRKKRLKPKRNAP